MLTPKMSRRWLAYLLERWLRQRRLKRERSGHQCEACGGQGILFTFTTKDATKVVDTESFSQPPTIERCDACKRYPSDDHAAAAVMRLVNEELS